ncbi:uncharacterized protein LOC134256472 [Saccostrea cucullata]|uniref:uncharacterized protein LOC134256472 n=1 Tax=Saccostrea cuccullata TaxID=36930 RepID=UPI002ED20F37
MFRHILIFSLVFLLLTDESDAWRRRVFRRIGRRIGRAVRKVVKGAGKAAVAIAKAKAVIGTVKTVAAAVGKRSVDNNVFTINVCNFSSFDLNDNNVITEDEVDTLIEMTGAVDLDQFFELIDINKDGQITLQEYNDSNIIMESCLVK